MIHDRESDIPQLPYAATAFSDELCRCFGEVCLEFAALEGLLFESLADLTSAEYFIPAVHLTGVPYSGLVDRLYSVAVLTVREDAQAIAEAQTLRAALSDMGERRNGLVHSNWIPARAPGLALRIKASIRGKGGIRFDTSLASLEDLRVLAGDIRGVATRVGTFTSVLFEARARLRSDG